MDSNIARLAVALDPHLWKEKEVCKEANVSYEQMVRGLSTCVYLKCRLASRPDPKPARFWSRRRNNKWRPSKKAGWATELLPERPGAFAASLAGQGSRPYTDEERQGVVWSGRPAKQAPRPTVIDVIHGVPKVDAPKYDEEAWVTTNMRQYTMGTTMKALTKDGLASK